MGLILQILRAMLHKKIYPQKQSPKSSSKKYLDMDSDEDEYEEGGRQSKWVKTDSECKIIYSIHTYVLPRFDVMHRLCDLCSVDINLQILF